MTGVLYRCMRCSATSYWAAGKCEACGDRSGLVKDAGAVNGRAPPTKLSDIASEEKPHLSTGVIGLDVVLSDGFVRGYSILFSGAPGLGKSTLALEAACMSGLRSLYATSEENMGRIAARATRLNFPKEHCTVFSESEGERILEELARGDYELAILDSVQTTSFRGQAFGSLQGMSELVIALHRWAVERGKIAILVSQENKDGEAMGPRALEHFVSATLSLEEARAPKGLEGKINLEGLRTLTCRKNREGVAPVSCFMLMTKDAGLACVEDPFRDQ